MQPPGIVSWLVQTEEDKEAWAEIANLINFFQDFDSNIKALGFDFFAWIFKLISDIVLVTPVWLFDNDWFRFTTQQMMLLSVSLTALLSAITGLKKGVRIGTQTPVQRILTRFPIALIGAGFTPYLFQKAFNVINYLSQSISQLGYSHIASTSTLKNTLHTFTGFDFLGLIAFDIALIGMAIPILLQNGRRWFDLLCLGVCSPLALCAWVFQEYEGYFSKWWASVKKLSLAQVYHAAFITLIGIIMFSTKGVSNPAELFVKLLIIIGGLWRMTHPPALVKSQADRGVDTPTMWNKARDNVKLKNLRKNKDIQLDEWPKKNRIKRRLKVTAGKWARKFKK